VQSTIKLSLAVLAMMLGACGNPAPVATPVVTPPVTGGDLDGRTARNCRAAIARQTGKSTSDVAVFDVAESEAGNTVQATVAGAEAPWICRTDRNGVVAQVMYSGRG
jgi:hypothetical protein